MFVSVCSSFFLSKSSSNKIPFFHLGPKNDWKSMIDKNYQEKLNLIFDSQEFVRFTACASAILIPYLFFLNLKIKFPDIEKNILFIFSLSIYLYPSFRYSAVWANDHITALIFFLLSTLFYFKWEKIKAYYLNKDLILSTFFLALAVYTRQYY